MKIKQISVKNYRNLSDDKITFGESCNFIVGENNIGKSNVLDLLNVIFSKKGFVPNDFRDSKSGIEVTLKLKLTDEEKLKLTDGEKLKPTDGEIGCFGESSDVNDYKEITILCRQGSPNDNLEFSHYQSRDHISPIAVRSLNYVHYDSLRNPISEINFDKHRGVGQFLSHLVDAFLVGNSISIEDIMKDSLTGRLVEDINKKLVKIRSFKHNNVRAFLEGDVSTVLQGVVSLKDGKGGLLTQSGYGIQFLLLVILSILNKLKSITDKGRDKGKTGKRIISMVVGLDEPEIHLHPYMQRSLIKFLNCVVNNADEDFKSLIKELFDIDELKGQIIVVTHSPSMILDDYRQITRLYLKNNQTHMVSGTSLDTGTPDSKEFERRLVPQFPFVKEAFFSKGVIVVEGSTELGCLPEFGKILEIDFDDFGISVIQAGGKKAVPGLMKLVRKFGIPVVAIVDSDGSKKLDGTDPDLLETDERDFEAELVKVINEENKSEWVNSIFKVINPEWENYTAQKAAVNEAIKDYGLPEIRIDHDVKFLEAQKGSIDLLKTVLLVWLTTNKGQFFGWQLGKNIPKSFIPKKYIELIKRAKQYVS